MRRPFLALALAASGGSVLAARAQAQEPAHAAVTYLAAAAGYDSLRVLVDQGLRGNRHDDYDLALAFVDELLAAEPNDAVALHYRGFVLYRKASILVASKGDRTLIKSLFEEAGRALERSEAALRWPETRALRSAVVGQLIGFSGALGPMRLGPRAARLLDEAVAMGPDNPRVWMLRGVSAMFKPRLFGGGLGKAERDLQRALELFARDLPQSPAPWWGHAETYGWLGQVYVRQGKVEPARDAYARALMIEPTNAWVRDHLVPALDTVRR